MMTNRSDELHRGGVAMIQEHRQQNREISKKTVIQWFKRQTLHHKSHSEPGERHDNFPPSA